MDCRTCQSLLPEFALGHLAADERDAVARHLEDGCPECRRDLRETRETWALLAQSLPPAEVPPHVENVLRDRIARERKQTREDAAQPRPASAFTPERDEAVARRGGAFRVWLAVAASLFIAATIGLVAWMTYLRGQWDAQTRELARRTREMQRLESELSRAEELLDDNSRRLHFASLREAGPQSAVRGYVVWDPLSRQVHFFAFGLPRAAEGNVWRIWVAREGSPPVAAGTVTPREDGTASAIIDAPAEFGERFRVLVVEGPIEPPAEPAREPWVTAEME